jgi:putative acetyltransferase
MSGPATIDLRPEEPEDAAAIREVHRLAFGGDAEAAIVDAVRAADAAVLAMVAVEGGGTGPVMGYVLYTECWSPSRTGGCSRCSASRRWRCSRLSGPGIGTMLIESA